MQTVSVTVNGESHQVEVDDRLLLVDFLRDHLKLTGTKIGCAHGVCGSCTVRINGKLMRSCLRFAAQSDGDEVQTVEGLAGDEGLAPVQEAFWEEHALQCGFCTPGFLMLATDLLAEDRPFTDEEIRERISGNICRCTGYQSIVAAVQRALAGARATS